MDRWPIFQTLTFREFPFPVDRYEEYVDGKLISQGEVHFEIRFKQHNGGIFTKAGLITVNLQNNPVPEKILSKFEFDNCITNNDRLVFYINAEQSNINDAGLLAIGMVMGYSRKKKKYVENEPIIGNVFTIDQKVAKVAFRFVNPDRLIEFY